MTELQENVDFKFIKGEDDSVFLELLSGEYSGVIYRYGQVSVQEDKENESASLLFEFEVVDSGEFDSLLDDVGFKNHIGRILSNLVESQLEQQGLL